mgnify:CR=1 FL=1
MNRYEVRTAESTWMIFDNQEGKFIGAIFPSEADARAGMRAIVQAAKILDVIGTPEENRRTLVKSLLLDLNMTCKSCNLTYKDGADLEQLDITRYCDVENPAAMSVYLTCHCGHSGTYTFEPNPFITSNVSNDMYGIQPQVKDRACPGRAQGGK